MQDISASRLKQIQTCDLQSPHNTVWQPRAVHAAAAEGEELEQLSTPDRGLDFGCPHARKVIYF